MQYLGVDTGGTFTDFALFTPEGIKTYKVSSTPADPARAILEGISYFFSKINDLEIVHGTTVGTNAFLERKGAPTLLVTTHGFEDVLFIGRQNRSRIYDLFLTRPAPIIPRDQVTGVRERTLFDGSIQLPLGHTAGRRLRRLCRQRNIASVAVCLLHAYANPAHERQLKKQLQPLGIPVTLSSELLPEFREYERLSTTLINAYLAPVIASYIERLHRAVHGVPLFIQQSNGGVLPAEGIAERAVHTILSGPAGGVQGAFLLAGQMGMNRIVTFDMGGTSTDVSLCDGGLTMTRDYTIDSYPVRNQVIDIHTVGAGGGSLAWIDAGGLLQVGPRSAGADPGPVCYGKGEEITVTDANLFLGRIPDQLLGGRMRLDRQRTRRFMEKLAERLNMPARQAALGIIRIVNAAMAKAIRAVSLERGHDPKRFALFSFGGASGLHCCDLAGDLGMNAIIVPSRAGILSAQGMVMTDPAIDFTRACFKKGRTITGPELTRAMDNLAGHATAEARRLGLTGDLEVDRFLDLRYSGQAHELTVPFAGDPQQAFHEMHSRLFGYAMEEAELEAVTIRCTVRGSRHHPPLPRSSRPATGEPRPCTKKTIVLREDDAPLAPVFQRRDLRYGHTLPGPALIIDDYTTIVVQRHFTLTVDAWGNLIIRQR